ncbi:hypothetical protein CEXT_752241 [Caerostris extrusa]|uniref:Uncharacterized protein n=1 Tax=Caerostris extrusa TaxID=172846 RepID=A0AAV4QKW9_CAEEX|nr:hypothetical protein CEXT_752241 [Caerostris extrusa]
MIPRRHLEEESESLYSSPPNGKYFLVKDKISECHGQGMPPSTFQRGALVYNSPHPLLTYHHFEGPFDWGSTRIQRSHRTKALK